MSNTWDCPVIISEWTSDVMLRAKRLTVMSLKSFRSLTKVQWSDEFNPTKGIVFFSSLTFSCACTDFSIVLQINNCETVIELCKMRNTDTFPTFNYLIYVIKFALTRTWPTIDLLRQNTFHVFMNYELSKFWAWPW